MFSIQGCHPGLPGLNRLSPHYAGILIIHLNVLVVAVKLVVWRNRRQSAPADGDLVKVTGRRGHRSILNVARVIWLDFDFTIYSVPGFRVSGFRVPEFRVPGFREPGFGVPGFCVPGIRFGNRYASHHIALQTRLPEALSYTITLRVYRVRRIVYIV